MPPDSPEASPALAAPPADDIARVATPAADEGSVQVGRAFLQADRVGWRDRALVAMLTALPTLPRFGNGYTLDDEPLITAGVVGDLARLPAVFVNNAMYAAGKPGGDVDTYRPLSIATFFWDYALSGPATWSYHLTNLLAHLAVTLLVLELVRRLAPAAGRLAWLGGALFFGLHPAGAEAHVWINGRSDVFMALAGVASLLLLFDGLRATGRARRARLAAVPALTLLACLFKETWVLLVPSAFLVARLASTSPHGALGEGTTPDGPVGTARPGTARPGTAGMGAALRALVLPLAGVAAYACLRIAVLGGARAGTGPTLQDAVLRAGVVWLDGLRTVVLPTRLSMRVLRDDYASLTNGLFLVALALCLVLGAVLAFRLVRPRSAPSLVDLALVSLATSLLPIPVIAVSGWPGFHRYLYVPIALAAPLVAFAFARLPDGLARRGGVAALALFFGARSLALTGVYASMETFALAILDENERVPLAWDALGQVAMRAEDPAMAAWYFERAVSTGPPACPTLERFALALLLSGRPDRAAPLADRALPDCGARFPQLYNVSAMAWMHGNPATAVERALTCLVVDPTAATCATNLHRWCTDHPAAAQFRDAVHAATAADAAYASLRSRVAPCVGASLPPPNQPLRRK